MPTTTMTMAVLPQHNASLLDALRDIQARQAAIEAKLDVLLAQNRPAARTTLNRSDRDVLARLLPAIGGKFGSERFRICELFESDSPALRVVLKGVKRSVVGQMFRRSEGQPIDGYVVTRDGEEFRVGVWRVFREGHVSRPRLHDNADPATMTSKEFTTS